MTIKKPSWQCYVINLERSPERWQRVQQHFASLSIPVIRIPAIDGQKSPDLAQKPFFMAWDFAFRTGRKALPGEIGCYASHLKTIRTFLASDAEFALICEDDVVPQADLVKVMEDATAIPGWEILRLAECRKQSFVPWKPLSEGRFLGTNITGFSYGAGYVLSRQGAEKILEKLSVMRLPYDIALFLGWRGVREMSVFPCPILLDYTKDYSTIKTCELYRFPILAILYFLYKCYSRLRRYTLQGIRTLGLRKKDCQKNPPKPACLRKFPYPKSHP